MPVILASGGLDSTVLFYALAKMPFAYGLDPSEEIHNFVVDYGQISYAGSVKNIEYHQSALKMGRTIEKKIELPLEDELANGPMFNANVRVPTDRYPTQDDFINGRNTILLAMASAHASAHQMDVFLGLHQEADEDTDRTMEFINSFITLQSSGGFSKDTIREIRVPFLENYMDKAQVACLGVHLGVPFKKTCSCPYVPVCGVCTACTGRAKATAIAEKTYARTKRGLKK